MASPNLDETRGEKRFKRIIPKLLEDIDALSTEHGVEVCILTKGPGETIPTVWASPRMTAKLLEANKVAEVDHPLEDRKKLEDRLVKLKQMQELVEKLKEKKRSEHASVKHQLNDDGKSNNI
ncbi:unnamed protein product [Trifolium pratense]|uniref:Uncharacterized protein n=1 Tax=Trifolium pratense TaxID=57577 RepID=A0ACB0IKM4_TRIPR|nr:unnamed protein product [Trifolium pratense]